MPPSRTHLKDQPIPVLVRSISIPVITGMFFQTMYNVVDTWAAGRLSISALAALSASFPVFFLIIAVCHGCQSATAALMSHSLGAEDHDLEHKWGAQSLLFALGMSVGVGVMGWVYTPQLLGIMQVKGEELTLATSYMRMIFLGTPCFVLSSALNGMLSAHGETRPFRDSLIVGFLLNIVLDLWFVFGGWGLSPMGFAGIARATVLLQGLTVVYMWVMAMRHGVLARVPWSGVIPRLALQGRLMGQGLPAMINMLTIAAGIFLYTYYAANLGTPVLAAFGTAMRIDQIALLPAIGLNTAAMTLTGHSLGAKRLDRIQETLWVCLRYGGYIYIVGGPLVAIFAPFWMSLFIDDPEVIAIGARCLRISMLAFYAYVMLFTITSVLQGLQRPMFAIWIGLYRQVLAPVLLVPVLMAHMIPSDLGIWWGACISVWSGVFITVIYGYGVWVRLKKQLG
ncbi:MATE family efflux transporter [Kiritimatiellota bacterium B12222]|nr:MATE family efflux transporter [Kiritimatiellota bacterium B12222]